MAELCSELVASRGQASDDDAALLALRIPPHAPAAAPAAPGGPPR